MVVVAAIAQRILDENNYASLSLPNVEYIVDNAIDYVNLEAGTSIAVLDGTTPAKTLSGTRDEIIVVKSLSALMVRAYCDRGPNTGIGSLSVTTVMTDPQYNLLTKIVERGIARLKGKVGIPFSVASDDADITEEV
jgi:hypothetical protein